MGKFIAIEGVMGVGKTTLLNRLNEELNIPCVAQDFEHNICLNDYYTGNNCAFQKQMIFLFSNYHILLETGRAFPAFISDYCFERSLIVSKSILEPEELGIFEECYSFLKQRLSMNKMMVFLYGDVEKILNNIKKRGRQNEQNISADYIYIQQQALKSSLEYLDANDIIEVDIDKVDILSDKFLNFLRPQIRQFLKG